MKYNLVHLPQEEEKRQSFSLYIEKINIYLNKYPKKTKQLYNWEQKAKILKEYIISKAKYMSEQPK